MFGVHALACRRTFHRSLRFLALAALSVGLPGCFERKQSAILNPDGSGKIFLETIVAVPSLGLPGKDKPTPLTFGRQVAADFINTTLGVDAWADVAVTELEGNRARIAATAYFKDINALRFNMPLVFVWKLDPGGAGATLSVERTRTAVGSAAAPSDADLKKLVAQAQDQYQQTRLALETQLKAFSLEMKFELPGEITQSSLFTRDAATVSITLDGKKAMQALDKFMADDAALAATFKAGQDLPSNDDLLLNSMYGQNGPVSAHVKFALTPAATEPATPATQPAAQAATRPQPAFDYRTEVRVAQIRQPDMLKDAGIDLIPKFIVDTQPATKPAAAGRGR